MANFETFKDLKLGALDRAGELLDGTSDWDSIVEDQINQFYRSLIAGGNEFNVDFGDSFAWARASNPGVLEYKIPFNTGTAATTQGNSSITLSAAPTGLGSLKGHFFRIDNEDTIYRISSHTADSTTVVLDQNYLELSGSFGFKIMKLDYDLVSGIERLISPMRVFKRNAANDPVGILELIDTSAFDLDYPLTHIVGGVPDRGTLVKDIEGLKTVRFSRYNDSDTSFRFEYDYNPQVNDLRIVDFLDADVTTGTELITSAAHGFENGDRVKLESTGTLPAGLSLDSLYFIIEATADDFKLSTSENGSAVDITAAAGGGTHSVISLPVIPRSYRKLLMYVGAHFVLVDKSDSRSDYYFRQAQATLQNMLVNERRTKRQVSTNRARLISRADDGYGSARDRFGLRIGTDV